MVQPKANEKIKELFLDILERHRSYCTDDPNDRTMLAQRIAEDLTVFDFDDVTRIAHTFFPGCEVDETFYESEIVIYTALHNAAAGGDEPLLFNKEEKYIFEDVQTTDIIKEEETDEWDIAFISEGASLKQGEN
jgi:hypothetical protein